MNEALDRAASTFAGTILARVRIFRDIVSAKENPKVIGDFMEELFRDYINSWLAPMGIFNGSLWSAASEKMLQIDGLVWQPSFGPPLMRQGNFLVLHPKTVGAAVEIKTSVKNLRVEVHERLKHIWQNYLEPFGHPEKNAIGIVLVHPNPEKASNPTWNLVEGTKTALHTRALHAYPIYILFKRTAQYEYEPYMPAIREMMFRFNYIANDRRLNALL